GHRTRRQLLQPGALWETHRPALGPPHRCPAPPGGVPELRDVPADLPLRADVEPGACGGAGLARSAAPGPCPRRLRPLRGWLLGVSDLRGAAARRPGQAPARVAPELLRRLDACRGRPNLVRPESDRQPGDPAG